MSLFQILILIYCLVHIFPTFSSILRQLPLIPPSPGFVSLETWLVKKEERVKLCQRLEYAEMRDGAVLFPPSPLHGQPSNVLPLFPLPATISQHVDDKIEEEGDGFIFPDAPIQPLAIYEYDQTQPPLDFFDYADGENITNTGESTERVQSVAEKDGEDEEGSEPNRAIEDVNNDLEENFEIGIALEDVVEEENEDVVEEELEDVVEEELEDVVGEENVGDAKRAGEDTDVDLEEIFSTTDSVESADEEILELDELEVLSGEDALKDDESGSSEDIGGSAIFDSIDLVRQAVEFLTVSK